MGGRDLSISCFDSGAKKTCDDGRDNFYMGGMRRVKENQSDEVDGMKQQVDSKTG